MNNKIIPIVVVLLLVIGGWFLFMDRGSEPAPVDSESMEGVVNTEEESVDVTDSSEVSSSPEVKEFNISGDNFSFSQKEIRVNEGDTVRIVFTNTSGMHDWKLDEFNASTKVLQSGQSETVEFVASKKGSFEYYCSVGSHRAMGMVGTLIVE